jgi:hypothetical protein
MLRLFERSSRVSHRTLSSAGSPSHFIDGITHPRTPPASRSSNPVFPPCNPDSAQPRWSPTHFVFNQAAPLHDFDSYASDRALVEYMHAMQAAFPAKTPSDGTLLSTVARFARSASSQIIHEHAFVAHANPPVLSTHDRTGTRRDHVEYHPSYAALCLSPISGFK